MNSLVDQENLRRVAWADVCMRGLLGESLTEAPKGAKGGPGSRGLPGLPGTDGSSGPAGPAGLLA